MRKQLSSFFQVVQGIPFPILLNHMILWLIFFSGITVLFLEKPRFSFAIAPSFGLLFSSLLQQGMEIYYYQKSRTQVDKLGKEAIDNIKALVQNKIVNESIVEKYSKPKKVEKKLAN